MPRPEDDARRTIDEDLERAGWVIQDADAASIHAGRGVALREFPLRRGHGFADCLLYVDGKAAGVVEAKQAGGRRGRRLSGKRSERAIRSRLCHVT
jgi:type I restriction enzyme R subunit